eukprot:CAMPEP_0114436556 /NCGR_PEP_ID=MMETSP0103-20121206/13524_1 /TAXON_ID=37642 ORGANISM="Paraphysomonas imperforata, Strain PA2" /NCGR_SAMPLE_ID=MMETSP0103 /ASSEMBLY_ACC=CAM_ASM_000201 /LENGTH=987 /DNA_ID=CAMNT_0001606851 /DNA_START=116 /DNA_END=3077 /DNA_ORIENTATION=+
MGNSPSTAPPPAPSKKRSRDEPGDEEVEDEGTTRRIRKMRKDRSSKCQSRPAEGVLTGRLLIKNCVVWKWLNDGLNLNYNSGVVASRRIRGEVTTDSQWMCVDHNGRISCISAAPILPDESKFTTVIDAKGSLVLPGLMDAHLHVMLAGESAYYLDLQGCPSINQLQSMLRQHIKQYPDLPWIVGINWDQTPFGRYPTRHDLDEVDAVTPVFLWRACWHIGVANTAALRRAGVDVTATSFEVAGGGEVECTSSGPTGILKESAVQLVAEAMGQKTFEDKKRFIAEGLARCSRMGLTSVQTNDEYAIEVYQSLMQKPFNKRSGHRDSEEGAKFDGGDGAAEGLQLPGGLPCRVFLTPVFEETLAANNTPLPSTATTTSASSSSSSSSIVSPTALASATKHERSTLLVLGKQPPMGRADYGVTHSLTDRDAPLESLFAKPEELDLGAQPSHFYIERVKIFGDGSLGAETAAISLAPEEEAEGLTEREHPLTSENDTTQTSRGERCDKEGLSPQTNEAARTVKISFPADMEVDYSFQESVLQYMQLYGAVTHVSFHEYTSAAGEGEDACHLAEVQFTDVAGAKKCIDEWELTNPSTGPYRLRYIGENAFGESVMSMSSRDQKHSSCGEPPPATMMPPPDASYKGLLTHETTALVDMVAHCKRLGFRVEIHAIGDAAAKQAVYAIEKGGMLPSDRAVLTHCQILSEDIIKNMQRLGVIANVQPSFVPTDMKWVTDRVSATHMRWAYPWKTLLQTGVIVAGGECGALVYNWKTLLQTGVIVAGGSDAPIETCCPFTGMHDAILRQARAPPCLVDTEGKGDGQEVEGKVEVFRPEERVNFAEALWMYTVGAAFAANTEHFLGQVKEGYGADLVLVDPEICDNPAQLLDYQPEMVVVGGLVRYINPASAPQRGVTATGDLHACQVTDGDGHSASINLKGNLIPGKNGRLPAPSCTARSTPSRGAEGGLGLDVIVYHKLEKSTLARSLVGTHLLW